VTSARREISIASSWDRPRARGVVRCPFLLR
jgi:hypothetical protein